MNEITRLKDKDFQKGRRYIGASDVPTLALMNLRYNQTPLMLWEQKTGRADPWKGNERTRSGKELEPVTLKRGIQKLSDDVDIMRLYISIIRGRDYGAYRPLTEARHERGYIVAHADLVNTDKPYIMEAKTSGFFAAHRKEDVNYGYDLDDMSANGIPSSVFLQVQTQMLCYDIPEAYVTAIMDTGIHRLYGPIKAHRQTQEKILALCERFWWHVEKDEPPKPESWADVVKLNPVMDKESKTVVGGDDEQKAKEMKARAAALRKRAKEIDAELDDIKNAMGLIIGGNKYLESSSGESLASAFDVARESIALKDLRDKHPGWSKKLAAEGLIKESKYRNIKF
jgi:hypothetical protein